MTEIEQTQAWLEKAVIGLNLCPFAKAVHIKKQIRWVRSAAQTSAALLLDLQAELQTLMEAEPACIDTTMLIHPQVLHDFLDFNDFLDLADALLQDMQLDGVVQIASFHPHYQFAGTADDDISNCSNRAPFPTLHLLREDSVARAVAAYPQAEVIFERNVQTLKALGLTGWQALGLAQHKP
jgi:uncharacterized protein